MEVSFSSSFKRAFKKHIKGNADKTAKVGTVYGRSIRRQLKNSQAIE